MAEGAKSIDLAVIDELQHDKKKLLETKSKSNDIIREHEQIVKKTDMELSELETALQYHKKRYLRENPGALVEIGDESRPADEGKPVLELLIAAEDYVLSPLDIAALEVIDRYGGRRISVRTVAESLKHSNFPTRAADFATFTTVVGNTLRRLEENGKIGLEKTGRYVMYYSLKTSVPNS